MSERLLVLAVAVAVAISIASFGGVGVAAAQTQTDLDIEAALDDTDSGTVSFTFVASESGTVDATSQASDGDVSFEFHQWTNLDTGDSGPSSSWSVEGGNEYEVIYDVTAGSDSEDRTHSVTVDVEPEVSETLAADVDVLEPRFGSVSPDDVTVMSGEGDGGDATRTNAVPIQNTGEGVLVPTQLDASTPSGISVSLESLPSRIDAGSTDDATVEVTVDESVGEGTYDVSGTVQDNLNNSASFSFSVEVVETPIAGTDPEPYDVGDVLVGGTSYRDVVVVEEGGNQGLDGVSASVVSDDPDASISFSDLYAVQTDPGGTDTAEARISVDSDAEQHEELSWTVALQPDDPDAAATEVDIVGRVIYPQEFGDVGLVRTGAGNEVTFDEPRAETDTIIETVELDVPNAGDLELSLSSVSVTADHPDIDAAVVDRPDTIAGQSSEEVIVEITADTDLPEGEYAISGTVSAESYDVDSASFADQISVVHDTEVELNPSTVTIGDVPIGGSERRSITVAETLGYNDVTDVSLQRVEGPENDWLVVTDGLSSRLDAASSESVVVELEFDTGADIGNDYRWVLVVDGEGIEEQRLPVEATPVPLNLDPVREELQSVDGLEEPYASIADDTNAIVDDLDSGIRENEYSPEDVSSMLTFGQTTILYLEAITDAAEAIEAGEHDEAQSDLVRAAAAYNAMNLYNQGIKDDDIRSDTQAVVDDAGKGLEEQLDRQESHYDERLASENTTLIEEATVSRRLAQIALLQGDADRAEALQSDSEAAFEAYSRTVTAGETELQAAESTWSEMESELFVTVAGQPLLVNPAKADAFMDGAEEVRSRYAAAGAAFEEAGETTRAEEVESERAARESDLRVARLSLYGSSFLYVFLVVGLVGRTARGMYWYLRDASELGMGDFLV